MSAIIIVSASVKKILIIVKLKIIKIVIIILILIKKTETIKIILKILNMEQIVIKKIMLKVHLMKMKVE